MGIFRYSCLKSGSNAHFEKDWGYVLCFNTSGSVAIIHPIFFIINYDKINFMLEYIN